MGTASSVVDITPTPEDAAAYTTEMFSKALKDHESTTEDHEYGTLITALAVEAERAWRPLMIYNHKDTDVAIVNTVTGSVRLFTIAVFKEAFGDSPTIKGIQD